MILSGRARSLALVSSLALLAAGYSWAQSVVPASDAVRVVTGGATAVAIPVLAAGAPVAVLPAAAAVMPAGATFDFGTQTHFHQGWSASTMGLVGQVGARLLRDTVPWGSSEKAPGVYDFSGAANATLLGHCATGGRLILTIVPSHPLYDGSRSVHSDAGRAAYANYVAALLRRFGACVSAIEVGNEVNGEGVLNYPAGLARGATYTALLQKLYATVKPAFPGVSILGGSTNAVGTGFMEELFKAGALAHVDGLAVHPYRSSGDGLALEIERLNTVMARYGAPKPIWATEFSYDKTDQRQVAAGMVQSVVELYAAGVTRASWYSLIDQQWFPNMGMFKGTAIKPAGQAYRMLADRVLPFGKPVRVDTGTLPITAYRIGTDRWIAWGATATLTFNRQVLVRDVVGNSVAAGTRVTLGAEPVLIEGATAFTITDAPVLADTLLQWGKAPWSYVRRGNGVDTALGWFDNDFTSYFGDRWSKPLRINNSSAAPAGTGAAPMRAIVRYTAPVAQSVELNACLNKSAATGDGVDYRVEHNGRLLSSGVLVSANAIRALRLQLAAGDRVDLVVGPNQTYGGDSFNYRVTLNRPGFAAPACP
jgi:hypothetical protein